MAIVVQIWCVMQMVKKKMMGVRIDNDDHNDVGYNNEGLYDNDRSMLSKEIDRRY